MLIKYSFLVLIFRCIISEVIIPQSIIGGLFSKDDSTRKAFSLAIRTMNECFYNHKICDLINQCKAGINCDVFHFIKFAALVLETDEDANNILKTVEELTRYSNKITTESENGLSGIIGSQNQVSSSYIKGLCELHDLPHIIIRPEVNHDRLRTINLYPDQETLSTVYVNMVKKLNWTSFSILYEKTEHFLSLDMLLKMYDPLGYPIFPIKLGTGPNYSQPLLLAKETNIRCLIIDCVPEHLSEILKQIQEVGMMTESYKYIITSLDLQTIDLRMYQFSGANISGLRLVDPNNPLVKEFVGTHLDDFDIKNIEQLSSKDALMFDAVAFFAQGYKDLVYGYEITGSKLSIKNYEPWAYGLSLRNYILFNYEEVKCLVDSIGFFYAMNKLMKYFKFVKIHTCTDDNSILNLENIKINTINGLTGPVMLDSDGYRRRFKLDILNLHKTGLMKIGTWNPDSGFDDFQLRNEMKTKHFNVLITLNPPYAMRVNYSKSLEGNDRYEGFVIDIIKELSRMIGFNYTFHVQEDSQNGVCNKTRSGQCICTGMMEQILNGKMQMAITDLTITEERESCVDFSTAFWNLGMSILYKKPMKAPRTHFSFLATFHSHVWIYLALIFIFVSVLFFILGRLSPSEWNNTFPCIEEPSELQNQFTISNSFWFTIGAIMQQGSEIAPTSKSTRTLAGCWWFFCLIIVSTYTANLTAFLTIESPVKVVRGIEDLYNQTAIKFGAKKDGSTFMYFQSSKNPKHRGLAEKMKSKEWEKWMVTSNEQAIHLAKTENYAFIMESSSIEYIQYRECDLEQAGPLIDQKSYAIAYAKKFEYHQEISRTISILQEKLVIMELYNKWWKEKGAVCFSSNSNTPAAMNLEQLAGVFSVLAIGIIFSCITTIWEFCRSVQMTSKKEKINFSSMFLSEIKHVTKSKAIKPALKRKKSTESNLSEGYSCNYTMTTQA